MHDPATHDVIIAGAGPVGLFLACELRLAGVSVLILEQAAHPQLVLKRLPFGMRGLSVPTLEAFDRRGLLARIAAPAPGRAGPATAHWMQQTRRPAGHFAGIQFFHDAVDSARWPYQLPTNPAGTGMASDMEHIESVLCAHAIALGVNIRRGIAVHACEQDDRCVQVLAGEEAFVARWLVGCDGGRSAVRKAGGFEFAGTAAEFTGYSLEVDLAEPHALAPGRHYTPAGMYTFQAPGTIALVDFDGGAFHRSAPVTLEHAQAVLRRVAGVDITLRTLEQAATWTDRAYQARTYRDRRILLAGDAAHIHSPLGGQGLNLGLGDAMNLGWKLAATIRGDAPDGLLDSYCAERHPVGSQILDWSRAQVALMRPSASTRALEAIMRDLIGTRDGATYFAERVWGVSLRYSVGDSHPLAGRSVPDFVLADGSRTGEWLRNGQGLLLDFSAGMTLQPLASTLGSRGRYVAMTALETFGVGALLVRPDGVVAWATDDAREHAGLVPAIARWFGAGAANQAVSAPPLHPI